MKNLMHLIMPFLLLTSLSKVTAQDTTYTSFIGSPKNWYTLEEMSYAKFGTVDLDGNGKIDTCDAIFTGKDMDEDNMNESVLIFRYRQNEHFLYIEENPDSAWFDMNKDGRYDIKIPGPNIKELIERMKEDAKKKSTLYLDKRG